MTEQQVFNGPISRHCRKRLPERPPAGRIKHLASERAPLIE
jgi:hypothetical protein